jgi:hypothetical protein
MQYSLLFLWAISYLVLSTPGPFNSEILQDSIFVEILPTAWTVLYIQLFDRLITTIDVKCTTTITSSCRA